MGISKIPALQQKLDEFTSSGTWVCPGGVNSVNVLMVGGGAGGGGVSAANTEVCAGGGGGAGAIVERILKVTPGTTYTITIGAGGSGGSGGAIGTVGGDTSIAAGATTLLIAYGGGAGGGVSAGAALTSAALVRGTTGGRGLRSATINQNSGGGGGGNLKDGTYNLSTYPFETQAFKGNNANFQTLTGMPGKFGIGYGGNGGAYVTDGTVTEPTAINGASGGWVTANPATEAGSNATANTGGGGGGAVSVGTTTTVNGGNGASGYLCLGYLL